MKSFGSSSSAHSTRSDGPFDASGSSAFSPNSAGAPLTRVRWTICAMLFFATSINYVDRQVLGLLAPTLQHSIGWTEAQYGYIVGAFQLAYAIGLVAAGRMVDRIVVASALP
jgi:MFS transporter, ACS family, hexuronate transporter